MLQPITTILVNVITFIIHSVIRAHYGIRYRGCEWWNKYSDVASNFESETIVKKKIRALMMASH